MLTVYILNCIWWWKVHELRHPKQGHTVLDLDSDVSVLRFDPDAVCFFSPIIDNIQIISYKIRILGRPFGTVRKGRHSAEGLLRKSGPRRRPHWTDWYTFLKFCLCNKYKFSDFRGGKAPKQDWKARGSGHVLPGNNHWPFVPIHSLPVETPRKRGRRPGDKWAGARAGNSLSLKIYARE
jgi:hypothetical protein